MPVSTRSQIKYQAWNNEYYAKMREEEAARKTAEKNAEDRITIRIAKTKATKEAKKKAKINAIRKAKETRTRNKKNLEKDIFQTERKWVQGYGYMDINDWYLAKQNARNTVDDKIAIRIAKTKATKEAKKQAKINAIRKAKETRARNKKNLEEDISQTERKWVQGYGYMDINDYFYKHF